MSTDIQYTGKAPSWHDRKTFRAFKHRNFSTFFLGQLVSMVGTWSQTLAVTWLVWRITGSPLWLGIVGFAIHFPALVFGLLGGAVADRYDRLKLLRIFQTISMIQAAILAWLTITGRVELWHIVVLSLGLGVVYAFEFPILQTFVMDLVGRLDLLGAMSMQTTIFHISRLIGPTLAGALVAWKGEGICFVINSISFLALIAALFMIDRKKLYGEKHAPQPILKSMKEGLGYARKITQAKLALTLIAILSMVGMQLVTLVPIFADRVFGGGALQLGWLMGASALGSLVGAVWLAGRHNSERLLRLSTKATILYAIAYISFGINRHLLIGLLIMMVMGFCFAISFSSMSTLIQNVAPDRLRGRMMSLFTTVFMGTAPFGHLMAGGIAKAIGAPFTIIIGGAFCLLASSWIYSRARKAEKEA